MKDYFRHIALAISTSLSGLRLTFKYLFEAREKRKPIGVADDNYFEQDKGIATLQYPFESLPVPDNGRYKLHNEIDDCIVCDKCAKVCPVDCIEIEPVRATEAIGNTSDGTPKRIYAAKFDIDMAKCCFCGLCTTVCPTECLTMTKSYDFSTFDVKDHNYSFAEMSLVEIAQKRNEFEEFQANKTKAKDIGVSDASGVAAKPKVVISKPVTGVKPVVGKPKPVLKPKPMIRKKPSDDRDN
ncbi:MAG: formate hydrogenlyase subunit 6/NADH:ubiquinone oxidoreductase subunit I [Cyclobacteriaceae bacterium]|jgi:formate hydrogenlyase subunit 6/NADH:ubiquinone oxidoreductase subunit I